VKIVAANDHLHAKKMYNKAICVRIPKFYIGRTYSAPQTSELDPPLPLPFVLHRPSHFAFFPPSMVLPTVYNCIAAIVFSLVKCLNVCI